MVAARPFALALAAALAGAGCANDAGDAGSKAAPAQPADAPPPPRPRKAEVVLAPDGGEDVPALVRAERERALREGRDLLVYVGAPWCEPCTRFHKAVEAGQLDAVFPTLRLLEFDLERDEARLAAAGYASKMIPLFAVPAPGGEASPLRIEGSIKGDGAVAEITPRLRALLLQARAR